jgi:hypothetical protein
MLLLPQAPPSTAAAAADSNGAVVESWFDHLQLIYDTHNYCNVPHSFPIDHRLRDGARLMASTIPSSIDINVFISLPLFFQIDHGIVVYGDNLSMVCIFCGGTITSFAPFHLERWTQKAYFNGRQGHLNSWGDERRWGVCPRLR